MQDPDHIATLYADETGFCNAIFASDQNRNRYNGARVPQALVQTSNPFGFDSNNHVPYDQLVHTLALSFRQPPKNINVGFLFGTDGDCDVRLTIPDNLAATRMISKKHFAITFDTRRRVVLQDFSSNGTIVIYDDEAGTEVRRNFSWILFSHPKKIEVRLPGANVSFRIQLAVPGLGSRGYDDRVDEFLEARRSCVNLGARGPLFQHLGMGKKTPLPSPLPRQRPIYLPLELLGEDGFGAVHKVRDVSTGEMYALKSFFREDTKQLVKRELGIMRDVKHKHIIDFVNAFEEPSPCLIMELARCGSLKSQSKVQPFSLVETVQVLVQCLQALSYLQSAKLSHRDVKPDNILVINRNPLHVKLADFGLAKQEIPNGSGLKTRVGTDRYAAPEIYDGDRYSPKVDIWSLGVVLLEYAYQLPPQPGGFSIREWQSSIVESSSRLPRNGLTHLLSTGMLIMAPSKRKWAQECLPAAESILATTLNPPVRFQTQNVLARSWSANCSYDPVPTMRDLPHVLPKDAPLSTQANQTIPRKRSRVLTRENSSSFSDISAFKRQFFSHGNPRDDSRFAISGVDVDDTNHGSRSFTSRRPETEPAVCHGISSRSIRG